MSCVGVTEECPEKRKKGYPAEGGTPKGCGACDRKRENLKNAGEDGHGPEAQGDLSHRV
jgi:hypothetical protein